MVTSKPKLPEATTANDNALKPNSYSAGLDNILKGYMSPDFGQKIAAFYSNPSHIPEIPYFGFKPETTAAPEVSKVKGQTGGNNEVLLPNCSQIKMMKRAIKEVFESKFQFQTTAVRLGESS